MFFWLVSDNVFFWLVSDNVFFFLVILLGVSSRIGVNGSGTRGRKRTTLER